MNIFLAKLRKSTFKQTLLIFPRTFHESMKAFLTNLLKVCLTKPSLSQNLPYYTSRAKLFLTRPTGPNLTKLPHPNHIFLYCASHKIS